MSKGNKVLISVAFLIAVAAYLVVNRYEIVIAGTGDNPTFRGYRLDNWTGEVRTYN